MIRIKQVSGIFTLAILLLFSTSLNAQTYANPELQKQEEEKFAKKIGWIKANPEAYKAQGGNPDDVIKYEASKAEKVIVKTNYPSPVSLDNLALFKLTSVTAIDPNHKHTEAEMIAFQKEAQSEWNKMNIVIDWETKQWYFIPRNTERKPLVKSFQVIENKIQLNDCKDCQSNSFELVEKSDREILLQLKPQDEGQYFVYQYELKK